MVPWLVHPFMKLQQYSMMSVRKVSLMWKHSEYKTEVFREHFVSLAVTQQLIPSMCLNYWH